MVDLFAVYTYSITVAFVHVLKLEKKNVRKSNIHNQDS